MTLSPARLWLGLAALVSASAGFAICWALATPSDAGARRKRIAELETRLADLPAVTAVRSPFAPEAVCTEALAAADAKLRTRLEDAARAAGATLTSVELEPEALPGGLGKLNIHLVFDGPYASTLNFSKIVADGAPSVFVQSAAVSRGDGEAASWSLAGAIYCRAGR